MNIFKEVINLCKDYLQKEKAMAKAYEEITEKMENGITLADQIVDVLKENNRLKEQLEYAKKIINNYYDNIKIGLIHNRVDMTELSKIIQETEQFLMLMEG